MTVNSSLKIAALAAALLTTVGCSRPGSDLDEVGAALAEEKGCVACHGLDGVGTGPTFPSIDGQWYSYSRNQLLKYRSGERVNAIMNGQVAELSDADIDTLAQYYSSR